ncbi:uncharacterized protein [Nicotiana sylvestris]|uniref:uncharacterized protein n=1 Tax=Nicotiana sylvestris TaxID=4096 RepID=UPI00388C7688
MHQVFGQKETRKSKPAQKGVKPAQVKAESIERYSGKSTADAKDPQLRQSWRSTVAKIREFQLWTFQVTADRDAFMRYKMANNDNLGNAIPGEEVDDNIDDEVPIVPQAQRRGCQANDNVPDPPPPPPRRGYFTGAPHQNAYKHIKGFMDTCWGSKQTNVSEDALRLRLFLFSLRGKALDWLERLPNHSITTWDELADKFIAKFSPGHMATLRDEILASKQEPNEPLHEIWERYWTMLAGENFMNTPYAKACEILDEMADTSSTWQSRANVPQGDPTVIHLHKELHDHGQISQSLNTRPKRALPSDTVVNPKSGNNTGHAMAVITRSGRGGDVNASKKKEIVSDVVEVQDDDVPIVYEQVSEENLNPEVRIDINDNEVETQDNVNQSREHVIDIPETVVPWAKTPLLRPPPPYPQMLAKQNNENQFRKFIDMMKSLSINVPLVKALEKMPGYVKFMKDLVTTKRSMDCETIKMTH